MPEKFTFGGAPVLQIPEKLIHLLYVPTIYCNLGCTYCYLGKQTDQNMLKKDFDRAVSTLDKAIKGFKAEGITPYNISLHGGEVTTLPSHVLGDLFEYIRDYYQDNKALLSRHNFKKDSTHIKTNLYNFDKHYDLLEENKVSISASLDLPLSLHDKYRVTKKGGSTLERTLSNVRLLAGYAHRKKMSAVVYAEHLDKTEDIISDIWYLHRDVGIDMNNFNFMFGFESSDNTEKFIATDNLDTKAVNDEGQVEFYNRLKKEFLGTELEEGFKKHWFDEFTPSYCTNAFNCGEKFFLLQSDGNVYSCVRGQGTKEFYYGNIHENSISEIMRKAEDKIISVHRSVGLHDDCKDCEYLSLCHTGCAYVKNEQSNGKSYTCSLQKEIYKDYPKLYPATPVENMKDERNNYIVDMHPQLITSDLKPNTGAVILPNDLHEKGNSLQELIDNDVNLQTLFSKNDLMLTINGEPLNLESQILKTSRSIHTISSKDEVILHINSKFMEAACNDPIRNTLHFQLLQDKAVVYGDEQRTKQSHVFNFEVFRTQLQESDVDGYDFSYDMKNMLKLFSASNLEGVLNNLMVTTQYLRRYHYEKQKNNAFYHIQAINLPFQNFEYYWV